MKRGMTLIEVMIALAVLSIGLLTLYYAILGGIHLNLKGKYRLLASQAASQEIEYLKQIGFDAIPLQTEGNFLFIPNELNQLPQGEGKLSVSLYEGISDIKKVDITILWQEFSKSASIEFSTLIYKEGLNQ